MRLFSAYRSRRWAQGKSTACEHEFNPVPSTQLYLLRTCPLICLGAESRCPPATYLIEPLDEGSANGVNIDFFEFCSS